MKKYFYIITILFVSNNVCASNIDFEIKGTTFSNYRINQIVREFIQNIMDENKCKQLTYDCDDLIKELENEKDNYHYTSYEFKNLKNDIKLANALKGYISAVGDCGNYNLKIEDFFLINKLVNADIVYLSKDEYCINFVIVTINDYITYMAYNESEKSYSIKWTWEYNNGGYGSVGVPKKNIRQHIYNNRNDNNYRKKNIVVLKCREF